MKKISTIIVSALSIIAISSCNTRQNECRIHGTVAESGMYEYEGKYIFLVPLEKPDSIGVDSVPIHNNTFEFTTNKSVMATIRLGYKYRYGKQDLLVVLEDGDVYVKIDSISSSYGTPQNNALQSWKELTEGRVVKYNTLMKAAKAAKTAGDMDSHETLRQQAFEINSAYIKRTHELTDSLGEGILYDFLNKIYPSKQN